MAGTLLVTVQVAVVEGQVHSLQLLYLETVELAHLVLLLFITKKKD
jgi:hypothetical protein